MLGRLPGPPVLWIALWALFPWLNATANLLLEPESRSAVWDQSRTLVVLNYAAVSFAMAFTFWATTRLARRLEELPLAITDAVQLEDAKPFQRANSVAGPIAAALVCALAFGISALVDDGTAPALLRGTTWLLLGIPTWTFVWTYAVLQLGLDAIGRKQLRPNASLADPTLGLRPLGAAAFTGLWMLLVWLVPIVVTGTTDVVGVVLGGAVIGGALAAFFLSLFRVHRQMAALKGREVAAARGLFAEAYRPVRANPTLETLELRQPLLGASDLLEKRAHAIHEWPLDEGTVARVITVATSVTAITVARLILEPIGL